MINYRDRKSFESHQKNSTSCSYDWHFWCFWSVFRHFGIHFAEIFHMSKSSWMMDPTRSREMPSCSAIDLDKIFQDQLVNLINNLRCGHCFVSSTTRRITGGNWATQFLTVAYDSTCSRNVSVRMAWISFGALPYRKKSMITRVSMLLKSRASPDMLPFSLLAP
jgi:hypothetical protein